MDAGEAAQVQSQGVDDFWAACKKRSGYGRLADGPQSARWWFRLGLSASLWYPGVGFQTTMEWPGVSCSEYSQCGPRVDGCQGALVARRHPQRCSGLFREGKITLGGLASTGVLEAVQS